MRTATTTCATTWPQARWLDYLALTKPRVAVLVLFTVAAGALLAQRGQPDPTLLIHAVLGTALVAAGASALNQVLEKNSDALMQRTDQRPLPAGRLQPWEASCFGLLLGVGGLVYMALGLRQPLTVLITAFTFLTYVFLYTPLKRRTTLNTLVGAIPGALPPVIGWTAVRGHLDVAAVALFLILFVWQIPHFLAIAWIYRTDYARAGLRMLPVFDPTGRRTGWYMVLYCLTLIPVSLAPALGRQSGLLFGVAALLLGGAFLVSAWRFRRSPSTAQARRVLQASLLYLPVLLTMLLLDRLIGM